MADEDFVGKDGLTMSQRAARILPSEDALDSIALGVAEVAVKMLGTPECLTWEFDGAAPIAVDPSGTITVHLRPRKLLEKVG